MVTGTQNIGFIRKSVCLIKIEDLIYAVMISITYIRESVDADTLLTLLHKENNLPQLVPIVIAQVTSLSSNSVYIYIYARSHLCVKKQNQNRLIYRLFDTKEMVYPLMASTHSILQ